MSNSAAAAPTNSPVDVSMGMVVTLNPKIDRDARTVKDVIMCQVGEARGWDLHLESSFLEDLTGYVKKSMKGRVQCNMGHNWDNLFRQLGRFDNIRLSGNKVLGDLIVYKASNKSPDKPGMGDWFMDITEEDERSVMASIKFKMKGVYQYNEKGQKVYIRYSPWYGAEKQFEDKPAFAEFHSLRSCDIVEEGANTDALFSGNNTLDQFKAMISDPEFKTVLQEHGDEFAELSDFYKEKHSKSFFSHITSFFKGKQEDMSKETQDQNTTPTAEELQTQLSEKDQEIQDLNKKLQDLEAGRKVKEEEEEETAELSAEELQTQLSAKDQEIQQLQEKIKELEAQPAGEVTAGRSDDAHADTKKDLWLENPINKRAAEIATSTHHKAEAKA